MAYAVWHGVITDLAGNVVPLAQVEVRSELTGALVRVYADRDGATNKSNPFPADAQGQVAFYVAGGAYRIIARSGPFERVWRYVGIGTAQEADIEELGEYLQAGLVPVQTFAALDAIVPDSFPMGGVVLSDPVGTNNGYYTNQGSGWVYARPLPDTFARLYVTGGTVNAVQATLDAGVNPSAPSVFFIDVSAANTGPVTLTINSGNSGPVLNAAGNALSAGEWIGRVFFTREQDGSYRIVNDPASALAAAQSAYEADVARAAAVIAQNAAHGSAAAAWDSAGAAATSETNAAASATASGNSATAAAGSATTASTKANEASSSASSASGSATAAGNSAGAASTSAGQAAGSATDAAGSATSAATSAGTATTQADRSKDEADRAAAAAASVDSPVSYKPQTLTTAEQQQVRTNIGAINPTADVMAQQINGLSASGLPVDNDAFFMARGATGLKVYWQTIRNWLVSRANHTGTQAMNTIAGLVDALTNLTNATYGLEQDKVAKTGGALTGGFTSAGHNLGAMTGTVTPTVADGSSNYKYGTKGAALTLAAPANGYYTMQIDIANTTGTGAFTATGFNKVHGDFRIDNGAKHFLFINVSGADKVLTIVEAS